jgi:Tol biopolymer transport system component
VNLRARLTVLVFLLVVAVGSAAAGTERVTSGGVIALTGMSRGGSAQIYLYHVASGMLSQLTRGPGQHVAFGWSPNGSRLLVGAFPGSNNHGLYAMRADGSSQVRLAASWESNEAKWSPNGKRVAYLAANRSLYVVNSDGTHRRLLTRGVQLYTPSFFSPAFSWSPNGRKIVFVSSGGLSTVTTRGVPVFQRLSFTPLNPKFPEVWEPTWSPDGSRIAFMTEESPADVVAVVRADGSDLKLLPGDGVAHGPVWSPNGAWIAYGLNQGDEVIRPDGTTARTWVASWSGITFSPNSRRLAYVGGGGHYPNGDFFIASANGANSTRVLHLQHVIFELPLWRGGTATTETG